MAVYSETDLVALRDRNEAWLMTQPGVTGTSIGLGPSAQVVLRVFTKGISAETKLAIAGKLKDVPIAWDEGEIVAY